jgi:hypothetical protein
MNQLFGAPCVFFQGKPAPVAVSEANVTQPVTSTVADAVTVAWFVALAEAVFG